ncbi:HAD family hydrolase [Bifidobacterium gallicum]|uniref:HAD family hydrolase n=1 Tax=Bifidobacterium gallicum DSM 20093 = LMG 11596 TaxID=561180 RepID=D1NSI3_9BIFI|nr:HAD family phosphatase [Bifidobacterium gallicum]EFA23635.1 HAD hydrolase, family IA, variant 3 [Bifidobacterium gallicum DSM 20093 = LMG 11596]KFI58696.1 HAD family hydrolase [Bifidobacterium gallicum DSM 20093 = LMG 11596]
MTASQSPITDIVFDFCGVLVNWQCRAALEGRYDPDLVDRICADDDLLGFFHYEDLMDGGMLLEDVLPIIAREQGADIAEVYRDYIAHYGDALPSLIDGSLELLEDLDKAGYRLWGLTNWSGETFHFAFERFPELAEHLRDTIVSGTERLHKPEAPIYELAIARFDLDPARSVFLDDTVRNVDGARAVGFNGLVFSTSAQARNDLRKLGVTC